MARTAKVPAKKATTMTKLADEIYDFGACVESKNYVASKRTLQQAWDDCTNPMWMISAWIIALVADPAQIDELCDAVNRAFDDYEEKMVDDALTAPKWLLEETFKDLRSVIWGDGPSRAEVREKVKEIFDRDDFDCSMLREAFNDAIKRNFPVNFDPDFVEPKDSWDLYGVYTYYDRPCFHTVINNVFDVLPAGTSISDKDMCDILREYLECPERWLFTEAHRILVKETRRRKHQTRTETRY